MYSTSYNCGIWSAPESGEGANQGLGSSTPTTAASIKALLQFSSVHPKTLCIWLGFMVKSHPILGNQETGEPRLGSPVFSHGKLYKPAQVDPTWTMNFVFKPVGPHVDLCTLRFLIFELSLCLTEKHIKLAPSKNIWCELVHFCTSHIPQQPSAPMRYPDASTLTLLGKSVQSRKIQLLGFSATKIPRLILGGAEDSKIWNRQI